MNLSDSMKILGMVLSLSVILNGKSLGAESTKSAEATQSADHAGNMQFNDESEKDFPSRSFRTLQIVNSKGDVSVQGWSFDKVRIKIKKQAIAETSEKARRLFQGVHLRFRTSEGLIEVSNEYGKDSSIEERLRALQESQIRMDLQIYAPAHLKLQLWTVGGKITLKEWSNDAEVRSKDGFIAIDGFKASQLATSCVSCRTFLQDVQSSVRLFSESGAVHLSRVAGKSIYGETQSGAIHLRQVKGEQTYVTRSGVIEGRSVVGSIDYRIFDGSLELSQIVGSLSGRANQGSVKASFREWKPFPQTLLDSESGSIELTLPDQLSAEVELRSDEGTVRSEFLMRPLALKSGALLPPHQLVGRVQEGSDLLKITSQKGEIRLVRALRSSGL